MSKKENDVVKQIVFEDIISSAVQIPGVKVNRKQFLAEQFATKANNLEEIFDKGPVESGIKKEDIIMLSKKLILTRTSQSFIASFAAGIPGGFAMAATVPADILQFFGITLRLAQELSYLYGADDLWDDGKLDDEKVRNQLILYYGVMFGVSSAVSGVRVLSTQISKTVLKKIPQKALTKTFWYPIVKKTANLVGVAITKKAFAQGVSKVVPIIGGVISGSINFASLMPMANRLNKTLEKATFDYTDEEFNADIEIILNSEQLEKNDNKNEIISKKISKGINTAPNKISKFAVKRKNVNYNDPYEEIKKLKDLLDNNIITQEEFEHKKKQILDL